MAFIEISRYVSIIFCLLIIALFMGVNAYGEYYEYEDENGAVHFTDNPAAIPKKFKKQQKTRNDDYVENDSSVLKVNIKGNQVFVPVTISYKGKEVKANLLLDTGATTCTISPELAKRLNIRQEDSKLGLARGIGDAVFLVGRTKLDYVIVGPNRKYDIVASVIAGGNADGLLGMDFLRDLRYHIDFSSHTIKWGN